MKRWEIIMRIIMLILITLCCFTSAQAEPFSIISTAYPSGQPIPVLYTCDGKDISPPLSWRNPPANTKAYALILSSPDWTGNNGTYNFWVLYNLPAATQGLPQNANNHLPEGTLVGLNYYYETSYNGPCPPDNNLHHYVFNLFALDDFLNVIDGAEFDDVIKEIRHHSLGQAELMGTYQHAKKNN